MVLLYRVSRGFSIKIFLARLDPEALGRTVSALCRRLLRSRAFEDARIRRKYWQVILDETQIHNTTEELDEKCMYRIHKKGTAEEYRVLKGMKGNHQEKILEDGKEWYDHVTDTDYRGYRVNMAEYGEERKIWIRKGKKKGEWKEKKAEFRFVTDLPLGDKNVRGVVERGRMRWKIKNEGFNTQKNGGYELEHLFSRNYQALKNHYYLIQIGNMISQVMETWESMWKKVKQSRKQKHQRILEDFKRIKVKEILKEERIQIRL